MEVARAVRADLTAGLSPAQIAVKRELSLASTYRLLNGSRLPEPDAVPRALRPRAPSHASQNALLGEVRQRLTETTVIGAGCWFSSYAGRRDSLRVGGRHHRLARLAYLAFVGDLPPGKIVTRVCMPHTSELPVGEGRGFCWRPDHLRVLPHGTRPPRRPGYAKKEKRSCPHGHYFTLGNVRFRATRTGAVTRACRQCGLETRRRQLAARGTPPASPPSSPPWPTLTSPP